MTSPVHPTKRVELNGPLALDLTAQLHCSSFGADADTCGERIVTRLAVGLT